MTTNQSEPYFKPGQEYRNRTQHYKVIRIIGKNILVKFDDGMVKLIGADLAEKIDSNMAKEDNRQLQPILKRSPKSQVPVDVDAESYNKSDFAFTVALLAKHGFFTVEVHPTSRSSFEQEYRQATGESAKDNPYVVEINNDGTWGSALRVTFPKQINEHPRFCLPGNPYLMDNSKEDTMVLTNNGIWWHLVRKLGFKAGRYQDMEVIKSKLPESVRADFQEGLDYNPMVRGFKPFCMVAGASMEAA